MLSTFDIVMCYVQHMLSTIDIVMCNAQHILLTWTLANTNKIWHCNVQHTARAIEIDFSYHFMDSAQAGHMNFLD